MSDVWSPLAQTYAQNRTGYSRDLYETIAQFGLRRGASILDVGCGTGLASQPFARNGFPVTGVDPSPAMLAQARERLPGADFIEGRAEALPFQDAQFDVVVSAQAYHRFDRAQALSEAHRVLRPGGIIAIWWKHVMEHERLTEIRGEAFRALGKEPPASGLPGGFREFYGSDRFARQTLRVIPWRTTMTLEQYMGYERSRLNVREQLGAQADAYFTELDRRLHELAGPGDPVIPVPYIQYLYLAAKA